MCIQSSALYFHVPVEMKGWVYLESKIFQWKSWVNSGMISIFRASDTLRTHVKGYNDFICLFYLLIGKIRLINGFLQ